MEQVEFTEIKYPDMRNNLIAYTESLSDSEYQRQYWGKSNPDNPSFYDDFDASVNFLDDMLERDSDPNAWIGLVLKNDKEAKLFEALNENIAKLFQKYGFDLTDEQYMDVKEWSEILNSAKTLHSELMLEHT